MVSDNFTNNIRSLASAFRVKLTVDEIATYYNSLKKFDEQTLFAVFERMKLNAEFPKIRDIILECNKTLKTAPSVDTNFPRLFTGIQCSCGSRKTFHNSVLEETPAGAGFVCGSCFRYYTKEYVVKNRGEDGWVVSPEWEAANKVKVKDVMDNFQLPF